MLQLDLCGRPPVAAVLKVHLKAEPVKPRRTQHGLFVPSSPEPEKLELTVARLRHLVGEGQVGTPEVRDTHRPDSFFMRGFAPQTAVSAEPDCRGGAACFGNERAAVFTPFPSTAVCAGDRGEPPAGADRVAIGERAGGDGERPVAHVGRVVAGRKRVESR